MYVLQKHALLHYYQGYHDVCAIVTVVMGMQDAFSVMEKLSLHYLSDAMQESMQPIMNQLDLLYVLTKQGDAALYSFLIDSDTPPYFAVSWVLTWFSHDVENIKAVKRLFDLFICSNPLMPVYVSTALILENADIILSAEMEFSVIHTLIKSLTINANWSEIIESAVRLYSQYPPRKLQQLARKSLGKRSAVSLYERRFEMSNTVKGTRQKRHAWSLWVATVVVGLTAIFLGIYYIQGQHIYK